MQAIQEFIEGSHCFRQARNLYLCSKGMHAIHILLILFLPTNSEHLLLTRALLFLQIKLTQDAGAIGCIFYNNAEGGAIGMVKRVDLLMKVQMNYLYQRGSG